MTSPLESLKLVKIYDTNGDEYELIEDHNIILKNKLVYRTLNKPINELIDGKIDVHNDLEFFGWLTEEYIDRLHLSRVPHYYEDKADYQDWLRQLCDGCFHSNGKPRSKPKCKHVAGYNAAINKV